MWYVIVFVLGFSIAFFLDFWLAKFYKERFESECEVNELLTRKYLKDKD